MAAKLTQRMLDKNPQATWAYRQLASLTSGQGDILHVRRRRRHLGSAAVERHDRHFRREAAIRTAENEGLHWVMAVN
jgi:hypothetical protein